MNIALATETTDNTLAVGYAKKLAGTILARTDLVRPTTLHKAQLIKGKLFIFKAVLTLDPVNDKIIIFQHHSGSRFAITPQVEESFYDLTDDDNQTYLVSNAGTKYFVGKDDQFQNFGNTYWVGSDNATILSYKGPTNCQVSSNSADQQIGISREIAPNVWVPYDRYVYKDGKKIYPTYKGLQDEFILAAAYIKDLNNTQYLVIAVCEFIAAGTIVPTIGEESLVTISSESTSTLSFYYIDSLNNWVESDEFFTLASLPSKAAYFSGDGLSLFVENRVFNLTAGSAGSFTVVENTANTQTSTGGTLSINNPPATLEDYGYKESWCDGTYTLSSGEYLLNNIPQASIEYLNVIDPNNINTSFGITGISCSISTNTTRSYAALTTPTERPISGINGTGGFVFGGDADVFMELSRYLPMLLKGSSATVFGIPKRGNFVFSDSTSISAQYRDRPAIIGKHPVIDVRLNSILSGVSGIVTGKESAANMILKAESDVEAKHGLYTIATLSGTPLVSSQFNIDFTVDVELFIDSSNTTITPMSVEYHKYDTRDGIDLGVINTGDTFTAGESFFIKAIPTLHPWQELLYNPPINGYDSYVAVTIGKGSLLVRADNKSKTYNGSVYPYSGLSVTITGFLDGDTIADLTGTLIYTGDATTQSNAGSWAIIPSGLTSDKYNIEYQTGLVTISKASASITFSSTTKNYTGNVQYPTVTTTPVGLNVAFNLAPRGIGNYGLMATVNDINYTGSQSLGFIINPVIYAAGPVTAYYTGYPAAASISYLSDVPPVITYLKDGIPIEDPNGPINAGFYAYMYTFNGAGTYSLSGSNTLTINKAVDSIAVMPNITYTPAEAANIPNGFIYTTGGVPCVLVSTNTSVVQVTEFAWLVTGNSGTATISATSLGDDNHLPVTSPINVFTVTVGTLQDSISTIVFSGNIVTAAGGGAGTVSPTHTTADYPITYTATPTGKVTFAGAGSSICSCLTPGTYSITATSSGGGSYGPVTRTGTLTVKKFNQTITASVTGSPTTGYLWSASASSGLSIDWARDIKGIMDGIYTIAYSYTANGIAFYSDSFDNGIALSINMSTGETQKYHNSFSGLPVYTMSINQPGDTRYNPAPTVKVSF